MPKKRKPYKKPKCYILTDTGDNYIHHLSMWDKHGNLRYYNTKKKPYKLMEHDKATGILVVTRYQYCLKQGIYYSSYYTYDVICDYYPFFKGQCWAVVNSMERAKELIAGWRNQENEKARNCS